jgi:hypothetical protein
VTADRLALATRTKRAQRTSTCPSCRAVILPGMTIARLTAPPAWVHVRCVEVVRQLAATITDVSASRGGAAQEGTT